MSNKHLLLQLSDALGLRDHTSLRIVVQRRRLEMHAQQIPLYDSREITRAMIDPKHTGAIQLAEIMNNSEEVTRALELNYDSTGEEVVTRYENVHYKLLATIKKIFPYKSPKQRKPLETRRLCEEKMSKRKQGIIERERIMNTGTALTQWTFNSKTLVTHRIFEGQKIDQ